jgi:hypothetical protein
MYINKHNSIKLPFWLYLYCGKVEETALIDSSATENFVDYKAMARLHLRTKKLEQVHPIINITGTSNQAGDIMHYCNLLVTRGQKTGWEQFFVTNLGKDWFIFSYPWLWTFNPNIDWTTGTVKGPETWMETLLKGDLTRKDHLKEATKVAITQLKEGDKLYIVIKAIRTEPIKINKTTIAQQMAEKAYDAGKVNTEQTIPAGFKQLVLGKFGSKPIQTQFELNQTSSFRFGLENLAKKPNSLVLVWATTDHPKQFQTRFALDSLAHSSSSVVGFTFFIFTV